MSDWQRGRALLAVTSPLGPNALMAVAMSAHEEISQPFDIRLTLVSEQSEIDPDQLLHHGVDVALQHDGESVRHFHGIVQTFTADGGVGGRGLTRYQMRLVPRLWFLGQTSDCRIFQKKSVPDIIRTIVQEADMPAPVFRLQTPHKPRPYVTQFNETDLQFITRLLQEEGCFYFFEHQDGAHSFVVADHNAAFKPLPEGQMRFDSAVQADDVLTGWRRPRGTTHGRVQLVDYDPEAPQKQLDAQHRTVLKTGGAATRDVMHWPASSYDPGDVRALARYRLEASEAAQALMHGEGCNRTFVPGTSFTLAQDPLDGQQSGTFVLRSVAHEAHDDTVLGGGAGTGYSNSFTAFRTTVPWREPLSVSKPRMEGVHAALVIGPKGTEIHTDELGRVKVMFFWDHRREAHPDQAVWARVVNPWAGNGWGWQSTPRVGTEVAVAFMDGDPDRPVVLGGVYNGNDKPIFAVAQKTRSGIRTRSTLKGAASNFNELSFDDEKGKELVYVQAERDLTVLVKHDQTLTVDHCRVVYVKQDETITIDNNRSATITSGNDSLTVSKGNLTIEVSQGAIQISAMQSILLKVGETTVKLDPGGVTVNGMLLDFKAGAMLQTKAPMTQMKSDATMTVKAGLILLN